MSAQVKLSQKLRPVHGVLLLDKPQGLSSNAALQKVRRGIFQAQKAGHTGTIDPLATGLLPICFGEATKFTRFLLDSDKRYAVTFRCGQTTDTGDADGRLLQDMPLAQPLTETQIADVLANFVGPQQQVPSMYSALKHQGRPLYEYARAGIVVDRPARPITVYSIELQRIDSPFVQMNVQCSKGTYIRTLVEDIGQQLGVGAHVTALRRLQVGPFLLDEKRVFSLSALETCLEEQGSNGLDNCLLPISSLMSDWPVIRVAHSALYYLERGQAIISPQAPASGWVVIMLKQGGFLGVGEVVGEGRVAPRRLIAHDEIARVMAS